MALKNKKTKSRSLPDTLGGSLEKNPPEKRLQFVNADLASMIRKPAVNLEALPPVLRLLLVTDGTVTKSLEAYFWDPITVELQIQKPFTATKKINHLKNGPKESLLERNVLLRGQSGKIYVSAHSHLRLDLLPDKIAKQLVAGETSIGEAVRVSGLETYRELIDVGYEEEAISPDGLADEQTQEKEGLGEVVYRIYRINLNQKPAILITERFPLKVYG